MAISRGKFIDYCNVLCYILHCIVFFKDRHTLIFLVVLAVQAFVYVKVNKNEGGGTNKSDHSPAFKNCRIVDYI